MQLTPNFRLMKPDGTDPVNVQDLNDNMDVLDAEVVKKLDKTGDASNVVNKFTQAGSRTNLLSGEKLSVSFGKIMKWFVDLKDVAFSGRYSDLTDRPTIPAGGIADKSKIIDNLDDIAANTQTGYIAGALAVKELNQDLDGNRFGHTADGRPGWKDGADTVHPFSTPAIISMIQLLPDLNNYAENVITFDVSEKNKLHIDTMQSWYDDANISIDADGTVLFSKKHQTGGSNRVDTTDIGDIDVSQYNLITINFSVISKNGQGWGKLNNIIIS